MLKFINGVLLVFSILFFQGCTNLDEKNVEKISMNEPKYYANINEQGSSRNWEVSIYSDEIEKLMKVKIQYIGSDKELTNVSIKSVGFKVLHPTVENSNEPVYFEEFHLLKENPFEFRWYDLD
ncbi:hypothetical protein [Bacillus sp. OAE603]|uniref:hypothetical protein n=1 Tax=Gottfriedia sp. OAE603 TaxID=2663872 RepID=UPI0017892B56